MSPAEDPMATPHLAPQPTVLVVEDEVLVRLAVAEHLRVGGFRVVEAASGAEAQTLLAAGLNVDIVFSDVNMSGGDGVELAQWLAVNEIAAPVILTSGLPSSLEDARARCSNVRAFVIKPYDMDRLVKQLRTFTERS
jgi:CheY-like chemotaxis protein